MVQVLIYKACKIEEINEGETRGKEKVRVACTEKEKRKFIKKENYILKKFWNT